jgi:nucleoside-diphosphate-sugar epimerase
MNIKGKRVLITGGSSGIGFALAQALVAKPRGSVKIPRVWSLETPPPDDGRQGR